MRYKVGDVVKLRDDLEDDKIYGGVKYIEPMDYLKKLPVSIEDCIKDCCGERYWTNVDFGTWTITDEMIEGLWEECKSTEQVSKSEGKYKLIEVLNKIANGELKEGTKVIWDNEVYVFDGDDELTRTDRYDMAFDLWEDAYIGNLNDEIDLIEPDHSPDAGEMAEPTDNTTEKIEELNPNNYLNFVDYDKDDNEGYKLDANLAIMGDCSRGIKGIISKLNEVIRKINKE